MNFNPEHRIPPLGGSKSGLKIEDSRTVDATPQDQKNGIAPKGTIPFTRMKERVVLFVDYPP
jgi:hypothetical protein